MFIVSRVSPQAFHVPYMKADLYTRVRKRLADNIKAALDGRSINSVALNAGIPQRTFDRLTKVDRGAQLSSICVVGEALGLDAWELLMPAHTREERAAAVRFLRIYTTTSPAGRRSIDSALKFAQEELELSESTAKPPRRGDAG
jgi:hypothetical protein